MIDVAELPLKYRHIEVDSYVPEYPEALLERDVINEMFQFNQEDEEFDFTQQNSNQGSLDYLPDEGLDLKQFLADLEVSLINQALERHDFVVARAADILKLRRTTLVEKMRKYNLMRDETETDVE